MFLVPFAMFVYMLFYVLLPFNEEVTEFRKLQNMSPFLFWFTNYITDLLIHTIFCGIIYAVLYISDTHHIFEHQDYSEYQIMFDYYKSIIYMCFVYFSYFNNVTTVLWYCVYTTALRFRSIIHIDVEFVLISVVLLFNIQ